MLNAYHCSNPFSSFSWKKTTGCCCSMRWDPFGICFTHRLKRMLLPFWKRTGDTLFCHELLGQWAGDLEKTLNQLARPHTRRIGLGFTPKDKLPGMTWQPGEEHLFVLSGKENPFAGQKLFFLRFRMHKKDLASPKRRVFPQKSSFPAIDIRPFSLVKPQKKYRVCVRPVLRLQARRSSHIP